MNSISTTDMINRIIVPELWITLQMVLCSTLLSLLVGSFLAILLFITEEGGLSPNKVVFNSINSLVSIVRSFPFVIMMVSVIPLTRMIAGTIIGWKAALVPLTIAGSPHVARMFTNNLREVNKSLIEAAKSFGASNLQIILKVIIPDILPSLISSCTLVSIQILSLSTIAGTTGGGGLGTAAITFGYQTFNNKVMYSVTFVMFLLVMLIQLLGDWIYKKKK